MTNLGILNGATDDQIKVEVTMTPLISSPDAVNPSSHNVTFGVYVGSTFLNIHSKTVNLAHDAVVTNITVRFLSNII